ncbi:MAG TPA: dihydrofolate reductase family protein, partial [Nitrolancea sp.]|nr:dihydrofolate reductase family protein [Nitrolancea sp.]
SEAVDLRAGGLVRKISAGLFISIDGVIEAPDQWQMPYFSDEVGEIITTMMSNSGALLLGRKTYQDFAGFWADMDDSDPMASGLNAIPKLVASNTLQSVEWRNSTLISGNVLEEIARIKEQSGKDITMSGSGTLINSLLLAGLLDELHLLVQPIVVGHGAHLFENGGEHQPLTLVDSKTLPKGVIHLTYQSGK